MNIIRYLNWYQKTCCVFVLRWWFSYGNYSISWLLDKISFISENTPLISVSCQLLSLFCICARSYAHLEYQWLLTDIPTSIQLFHYVSWVKASRWILSGISTDIRRHYHILCWGSDGLTEIIHHRKFQKDDSKEYTTNKNFMVREASEHHFYAHVYMYV